MVRNEIVFIQDLADRNYRAGNKFRGLDNSLFIYLHDQTRMVNVSDNRIGGFPVSGDCNQRQIFAQTIKINLKYCLISRSIVNF